MKKALFALARSLQGPQSRPRQSQSSIINYQLSIPLLLLLALFSAPAQAKYSGGAGTPEAPYKIADYNDLYTLADDTNDYHKCFVMTADIDLDPNLPGRRHLTTALIAPDTNEESFYRGTAFTGMFDGNGLTFRNLVVDANAGDYLGLFGCVGDAGVVHRLRLANVRVRGVGTCRYVSGLAGANSGIVAHCFVSGSVSAGAMSELIGALVGFNSGSIVGSAVDCNVSGGDNCQSIGGLVGYHNSSIADCHSAGSVEGEVGSSEVGGLVGGHFGSITQSYSVCSVIGGSYVGGLAGKGFSDNYTEGYFLREADGGGPDNGLGTALSKEAMQQQSSFVSWDFVGESVSGTCDPWVMGGEPVGYPELRVHKGYLPVLSGGGTVEQPYAVGSASDLGAVWYRPWACYRLVCDVNLASVHWGLAPVPVFWGRFDGDGYVIHGMDVNGGECLGLFGDIVKGAVIEGVSMENVVVVGGTGSRNRGGLVGRNVEARIRDCSVTGSVIGGANSRLVGGLLGDSCCGQVRGCSTAVSVEGRFGVGGVVGRSHQDSIVKCSAAGSVRGENNVGGLLGYAYHEAVTHSSASVDVSGSGDVGGLIGYINDTSVINCSADGSVTGVDKVGGLVGHNEYGNIAHSYSSGEVAEANNAGGLVGYVWRSGRVWGSYFLDPSDGGGPDNGYGTMLSDAEMRDANSFEGWDFLGVYEDGTNESWAMGEGGGYPELSILGAFVPVFGVGSGTAEHPYVVRDVNELGAVCYEPSAHYVLEGDIDMDGVCWSLAPIPAFLGWLDGGGNSIVNLLVSGKSYIGLVGEMCGSDAEIRNLDLADVNMYGDVYVGGLVGHMREGRVSNCSARGVAGGGDNCTGVGGLVGYLGYECLIVNCNAVVGVSGGENSSYLGGLVGKNSGCIENSQAQGNVRGGYSLGGLAGSHLWKRISGCRANGNVSGKLCVGGLVGSNIPYGSIDASCAMGCTNGDFQTGGLVGWNSGDISRCFAVGDVNGGDETGGLVGYNFDGGVIRDSYAHGDVNGIDRVGGLIGYNEDSNVISCYSVGAVSGTSRVGGLLGQSSGEIDVSGWDVDTSGQTTSDGGAGLTTAEMQTESIFTEAAWDFNEVWAICEGTNYPRHIWSIPLADMLCPDGVTFIDYSYFADHWLASDYGDVNGLELSGNGKIENADFALFANWWGQTACGDCGGADYSGDNAVDSADLKILFAITGSAPITATARAQN